MTPANLMTMIAAPNSASPPMILSLVFTAPFPRRLVNAALSAVANNISRFARSAIWLVSCCQARGGDQQEAACNAFGPSAAAIVEARARSDCRKSEAEGGIEYPA